MAYIANVSIVVDEANEASVYDGINEILRDAQMGGPNGEDRDWVLDWKFQSVDAVNEALKDSIANGTYDEGEAFLDSASPRTTIMPSSRPKTPTRAAAFLERKEATMSKHMTLLAIATTAIRDIYMGYPVSEIHAPSGMGIKTLLRDLVSHLRNHGVDDEGGWDCDATEGIEVKRFPVFEPFKLVVKSYATSEFGEGPLWAEMTVTPEFLQTLERLRRVCQDENLESVTVSQGPDRWDQEDNLRIRGDSLRVWRDDFWFEAHPKRRDYNVETRSIPIDHLIQVAGKVAGNDVENPLPDGFAIRDGVVFYSMCDLVELADSYQCEEVVA